MKDKNYKCVNGHDLCNQMYPGPECPYCEEEWDTEEEDIEMFKKESLIDRFLEGDT